MIATFALGFCPSFYILYRIFSYVMFSVVLPWGMDQILPHLADYPTIYHIGYFIAH